MRRCGRKSWTTQPVRKMPILLAILVPTLFLAAVLATVASHTARCADADANAGQDNNAAGTAVDSTVTASERGAVAATASPTAARPGRVEFSDGRVLEGRISGTPGRQLKVFTSKSASRSFPLGSLQELRFAPLTAKMESAWRFSAMGSDEKEHAGAPIPHRELLTTATLANGESVVGQLDMTVLYVEKPAGAAEKLVLTHTQKGTAGQALRALVYPTRVVFTDAAPIAQESSLVDLSALAITPGTTLSAVRRESLKAVEVQPGAKPRTFRVASAFGEGLFLALHDGNRVQVGWPDGNAGDEELRARAEKATTEAKNFFTVRHLVAAWVDEPSGHLCALVTLGREKPEKWAGFPWRLSVWRWGYDKRTGNVQQPPEEGLLLRIVDAEKEAPPEVVLSAELWHLQETRP